MIKAIYSCMLKFGCIAQGIDRANNAKYMRVMDKISNIWIFVPVPEKLEVV